MILERLARAMDRRARSILPCAGSLLVVNFHKRIIDLYTQAVFATKALH
jgi:hypothetical protein